MSKIHLLRKITILLTLFLFIGVTSCSSKDEMMDPEEETQDPGDDDVPIDEETSDPVTGDPDLIVEEIQSDFLELLEGFNSSAMSLTRQQHMFGTYFNFTIDKSRFPWRRAYEILDGTVLLEKLNEQELYDVPNHLGLAKVLQAYTFLIMVDTMGDVPYSEALDPVMFPFPRLDEGAGIYNTQLAILDEAISLLNETTSEIPEDQYYLSGFSKNKWIALANTLKLRAYLNLRLVDPARATQGINAVLNSNYIDTFEEDFQFQYSNSLFPEGRHPFFSANYGVPGAQNYIANGLYDLTNAGDVELPFKEYGVQDPRLRYYFYRQSPNPPEGSDLPCEGDSSYDYCYVGNLYWGRDHADNTGVIDDNNAKTTFGIYPSGGAFDRNLFVRAIENDEHLEGAGIFPIYLSSFTNFALAEASLTLGTGSSPQSYLEQGIRLSMRKVSDFAVQVEQGGLGMTSQDVDDYVIRVLKEYNSANTSDKLEIIEREYYLASWGNGLETYNMYRRTGHPNLQSPIIDAGSFSRVYLYPLDVTSSNPNISQNFITDQTFWDNNPAGFID